MSTDRPSRNSGDDPQPRPDQPPAGSPEQSPPHPAVTLTRASNKAAEMTAAAASRPVRYAPASRPAEIPRSRAKRPASLARAPGPPGKTSRRRTPNAGTLIRPGRAALRNGRAGTRPTPRTCGAHARPTVTDRASPNPSAAWEQGPTAYHCQIPGSNASASNCATGRPRSKGNLRQPAPKASTEPHRGPRTAVKPRH
jgi:hypothetical protein